MNKINFWVIIRVLLGTLFLFSGGEKALQHHQNFLYVVQGYDLFPEGLDVWVAYSVPWIEIVIGLFLILGLWLKQALYAMAIMFAGFVCVVGQALLRGINLEECGCFGEAISIPPQGVIVMDVALFALTLMLLLRPEKTMQLSLDQKFDS